MITTMEDKLLMLSRLYTMAEIPFRHINIANGSVIFQYGYDIMSDPVCTDSALRQKLIAHLPKNMYPALLFEGECFLHAFFKVSNDACLIIGPATSVKVGMDSIKEYARNHEVKTDGFHIVHCSFPAFLATVSSLYHVFSRVLLSDEELLANSNIETASWGYNTYHSQQYLLNNSEEEILRLNYAEELRVIEQVRRGDVEGIMANFHSSEERIGKIGKLANSTFKQYEYMVCTSLALMSRGAIEGGLDPLTAYSMSDTYLQKLEGSKTIKDMLRLHFDIRLNYATQVSRAQKERSQHSYLESCKNYIAKNLNKPITVSSAALEIGINASYLSRQFSCEEGISITRYIHQKRVEAASNMLKYSNKSISEISAYLCFPSQSHFGKIFKELTGISPQKYRNREKLADFKE